MKVRHQPQCAGEGLCDCGADESNAYIAYLHAKIELMEDEARSGETLVTEAFPVGEQISSLWAWVSNLPDSGEGIINMRPGDGRSLPLVTAQELVARTTMASLARRAAQVIGKPVTLVRFTRRIEIEVIEP